MSAARFKPRPRLRADARRQQIIEAAFHAIAERGFEGFRTREVADRLGINSATLHHHFPTKDDLVAAVSDELARRFQSDKEKRTKPTSAISALESQFSDAKYYRTEHPLLLAVYREFMARAHRDPLIAALVARLNETWRKDIRRALDQASHQGILRPEIEPEAASRILLHAIWGLAASPEPRNSDHLDRAFQQLQSFVILSKRR
jgi:AcrR family transcriptional regulator